MYSYFEDSTLEDTLIVWSTEFGRTPLRKVLSTASRTVARSVHATYFKLQFITPDSSGYLGMREEVLS